MLFRLVRTVPNTPPMNPHCDEVLNAPPWMSLVVAPAEMPTIDLVRCADAGVAMHRLRPAMSRPILKRLIE